jgi:hypothetical protein
MGSSSTTRSGNARARAWRASSSRGTPNAVTDGRSVDEDVVLAYGVTKPLAAEVRPRRAATGMSRISKRRPCASVASLQRAPVVLHRSGSSPPGPDPRH